MNSKCFFDKYKNEQESHQFHTYGAIENVFDYLRQKKSIESIYIKGHEFLIDSNRKKALSLSLVTWKCMFKLFVHL